MNIPKFWARGESTRGFSCWQSSDLSVEDARQLAEARALELAEKLESGESVDRYGYGDRPLREEIIQTLDNNSAVVTRNLYGALVLNTASAMFIDVDFEDGAQTAKPKGFFSRFSSKAPPVDPQEKTLQQVRNWAGRFPNLSMRVYRTFAGLRCLIVNQTFDPTKQETLELLKNAGSDPLYIRLCKAQSCFRARLTPKPWRCGTRMPPARFPWTSSKQESMFRQWQSKYDNLIKGYCVCRLLQKIGLAAVHEDVNPIVTLHDQIACARPDRPLA